MGRSLAIFWFQLDGSGVDAVAQSRWWGSVVENMAQMRPAATARYFRALHEERVVFMLRNRCALCPVNRGKKTRPSTAAVKLFARLKKRFAAADAAISAGRFCVPILTAKRSLGALHSRDCKLLRSQSLSPFAICFWQ